MNVEGTWIYAEISPSKNMKKFQSFFTAIINEENDFDEACFSPEWLDDSNWFIVDDENRKKGIYIPAVYPNDEINWRWR
ncbi:hypothetical protein [Psychrobacillus sp. NPDC093180]|uniref:hypothetical protein n=1 Tax=Psychrobacillus sp. NPDC093180 TaxID=3364489 RepID=UPI0038268A94